MIGLLASARSFSDLCCVGTHPSSQPILLRCMNAAIGADLRNSRQWTRPPLSTEQPTMEGPCAGRAGQSNLTHCGVSRVEIPQCSNR
jgi:hypothetical protein